MFLLQGLVLYSHTYISLAIYTYCMYLYRIPIIALAASFSPVFLGFFAMTSTYLLHAHCHGVMFLPGVSIRRVHK